jgi:hypothetical protein
MIFEKQVSKLIGKTFWIKPNPKATLPVTFFDLPRLSGAEKFVVTEVRSFKAIALEGDNFLFQYLKVEFEDGKIGYLKLNSFAYSGGEKEKILDVLIGDDEPMYDFNEYVFPVPPEQFIASYKARLSKKLQSKNAKAGVKIGMTTSEVLSSSWGKPLSVNRTRTASGVREQWVYGGGNYLYFDDGRLSGIQN